MSRSYRFQELEALLRFSQNLVPILLRAIINNTISRNIRCSSVGLNKEKESSDSVENERENKPACSEDCFNYRIRHLVKMEIHPEREKDEDEKEYNGLTKIVYEIIIALRT